MDINRLTENKQIHMKKIFTTLFLVLITLISFSKNKFTTAEYTVTLKSLSPLKISVNANIPINGRTLNLDETYPADLPEMEKNGWSALISNLKVFALSGKEIKVTELGNKGWKLTDSIKSIIKLRYDVDYSLLAESGWSSFLESAFADDSNVIVVGRSIFITTNAMSEAKVKFVTPKDWISIVPWIGKSSKQSYLVKSLPQLVDNMLVFSRNKPTIVSAAGFTIKIVSMGHWRPLGSIVDEMIKTIITREVDFMNYKEKEIYTVVLVPVSDQGGNSFHQSFVYCYNNPTQDNKDIWGNTLAHEIFHYWNSSKLEGADYASSQWFQEGFTEYVANLIMVTGNIIDSTTFLNKLSKHVNNYRRLTTTLENYGTHKGPPLYSAGALVAFMWDIQIREATKWTM